MTAGRNVHCTSLHSGILYLYPHRVLLCIIQPLYEPYDLPFVLFTSPSRFTYHVAGYYDSEFALTVALSQTSSEDVIIVVLRSDAFHSAILSKFKTPSDNHLVLRSSL